jgi:ElaB/YqjD/DUF883 family membrane-anchored ribosome-binding protein
MNQSPGSGGNEQSMTDQVTEAVQDATSQAKEAVQEQSQRANEQMRARMTDEVGRRSTDAGEQVSAVGSAMRRTSADLRSEGSEQPAKVVEAIADRMERAGSYLRESDADQLMADAEDFGRRQPMAVIAGGVAVGFLAARFLKASSSRRYESRGNGRSMPAQVPSSRPMDRELPESIGTAAGV